MSSSPLRLPEDSKERAPAQAQAEAERSMVARGARAKPGRAREILARAGRRREPRAGDRLDEEQP